MPETATLDAPAQTPSTPAPTAQQPTPGARAAAAIVAASKDGKTVTRDEVKAQLKGGTDSTEPKPEAPAAGSKDAPAAATKAEKSDKGEKGKPGPKAGEKAAREARENATLAKHALRRDGFSDEEIDGLTPEALITVGLKAKARQDALTEELYGKGSKPNQPAKVARTEEAEGASRTREPKGFVDHTQPEPERDGPDAEGLDRVLAELDPEKAEIIASAFKASQAKAERSARELAEAAESARVALFKGRIDSAKSTLKADFPQLAEKAGFDQVLAFMDRLREPGKDPSSMSEAEITGMMREAAEAQFAREIIETNRVERANQLSQDIAGTPRVGGTSSSSAAKGSPSKGELAARLITEGKARGDSDETIRKNVRAATG